MDQIKKPAELVLLKISRQKTKGFTLLEILVVVTIIAGIATLVLPKLGVMPGQAKSEIRKFIGLSKQLQSQARLYNATYRIALLLPDSEDKDAEYQIWVEKTAGSVLNDYDPESPPPLPGSEEYEEKQQESPSGFANDTKTMKKPWVLVDKLRIDDVELARQDEPITSGIVYIHYLPSGFVDEAALHLTYKGKMKWTLALDPLTGRVDVIEKNVRLEDLRAK